MPTTPTDDAARKAREKEFHDREFAENARSSALGFYAVMDECTEFFLGEIRRRAAGAEVLEYGCGPGTHAFRVAQLARHVTGIDISDTAISQARARAEKTGAANVDFHVMDAENLTFPKASFDLVIGRSIVHHLDVERCFATITRVLKPGGTALFHEPLGHNPLINLYRRFTPSLRTPDEHPLLMSDLATARRYFHRVRLHPFILTALGASLLRNTVVFKPLYGALAALDRGLFALPGLSRYAWTSVWICEEPRL